MFMPVFSTLSPSLLSEIFLLLVLYAVFFPAHHLPPTCSSSSLLPRCTRLLQLLTTFRVSSSIIRVSTFDCPHFSIIKVLVIRHCKLASKILTVAPWSTCDVFPTLPKQGPLIFQGPLFCGGPYLSFHRVNSCLIKALGDGSNTSISRHDLTS